MEGCLGEDVLQKLALKAKKKLNKQNDEERILKRGISATYEFKEISLKKEREKLEKKVKSLLQSNSSCINPISKLIDKAIYDNLNENQKQAYILKLASEYREICEKLNK